MNENQEQGSAASADTKRAVREAMPAVSYEPIIQAVAARLRVTVTVDGCAPEFRTEEHRERLIAEGVNNTRERIEEWGRLGHFYADALENDELSVDVRNTIGDELGNLADRAGLVSVAQPELLRVLYPLLRLRAGQQDSEQEQDDEQDTNDDTPTEPEAAAPAPAADEDDQPSALDPEQTANWITDHPHYLPDFIINALNDALDRAAAATGLPAPAWDDDEEDFAETRRRIAALTERAQAIFWQGRPETSSEADSRPTTPAARPASYDQPITPERAREIISEFRHHDLDDKVLAAIIALACGIAYENDRLDREVLMTEVINGVYGHTYQGDTAASRFADRAAGMRFGAGARR